MNSDTENKLTICRLCLQNSDDVVNIWNTFQDSTISSILSKHFWFEIHEDDCLTKWLCQTCWLKTKTFHEFYKQVELFQKCYYEFGDADKKAATTSNRTDGPSLEPELIKVKCEIAEIQSDTADDVSRNDNDDDEDYTNDDNYISESETEKSFGRKTTRRNKKGSHSRSRKKPDDEKYEEMNSRIREFFNMDCQLCNEVGFETLIKIRQHYRKVHKTEGYITCCGKKYLNRYRVVQHVRLHINPDAYHCDQCNRSFSDEKALKSHVECHVPFENRKFKCKLCTSSFTKEYALTVHIKVSHTSKTGEKFPCDKCEKIFVSSYLLTSHIRQAHLAREYFCEVCARVFRNKHNLGRHIKNEHTITPKVQCEICGVWVKHMDMHLKLHEETKPLNCPTCNKEVRSERLLKKHITFVHGAKRHRCTLCEKVFKRASMLKEHFAIHTGVDLYNCPHCDKTFKSNANMYKHRKTVHAEKLTGSRVVSQTSTSTKVSAEA